MKRVRDEVYVDGQIRGPTVSSRGETNGRPLTIGGGGTTGALTTDAALTYLKAVKDMFHDNKEKYETFLGVMKDFKAQRVDTNGVITRIKDLFKGYDDLLLGFNTFLPKGYKITLQPEDEKPKKPVDFQVAIEFVNKIKARFGGDERAYKKFLDILNMYRKQTKSINEVYQEVTLLFQDHEDLLGEFFHFLPDFRGSVSVNNPLFRRNTVPHDRNSPFHAMHPKHYEKKIKRSKHDEYTELSDQREDGDENLVAYSAESLANHGQWPGYPKVEDTEGIQNYENNGDSKNLLSTNHMAKAINELDLAGCAQCTPSYRRLPDDYPIHIPSYRNSLGEKVLNDHWVSVTSGSEDYSFKHMRKNQYEESLFRCEDDRFELDMLLESVSATIKRVEILLEKINNNTISIETPICIREHLSVLNLRCIERLYGDYGLDVVDFLKKSSHTALPVILTRLKQKQKEWARCRSDFRKVWAEVYAKNHQKSLDHRSFYFKQQDSKNLSTKGLVAEIKDISERKHKEDLIRAVAVGNKPAFTPDMEFSYTDTQVHTDLYQLIKYYCEEIYATEQADKVMELWVTFLEPMLGVPSRSQTNETMKDVANIEDNQAHHDACEAVKENTCDGSLALNLKPLTPPKSPNKENPILQGSSFPQDIPLNTLESIQQDKLHDGATITNEVLQDSQPSKLVSPRNDMIMKGVENCSKVSDVSMGEHKVEREEGELSPTEIFEHENIEVYKENGLEPVQKLPDNEISNKDREYKEGAYGTEAGARSNIKPEDDENKITQKLSEGEENASKIIVSTSKFGGQVSSDEEHKGAMNCDRRDSVAESENEAGGMVNSNAGGDGSFVTFSERDLQRVKPLAKHVPGTLQASECDSRNDSRVFYGNDSFYMLFRLHQILYERIQLAKIHSERKSKAPDSTSTDSYTRFMDALYNLLDGSSDNTKFEDECRAIIGAQSYVLFTLDKLVQKFVKHLHAVAADETDTKLLQLYAYENYRKPGRFFDMVYHENARALLHDQNIYRIEYSSAQTRLSIQLMNRGNDKPEVTAVTVEPGFANYLQNDFLSFVSDEEKPGLFLKRNKAKLSGPGDESSGTSRAMEGLKIINEVECKIDCSSFKVQYEPNTTDILYRRKQKKAILNPTGPENVKTSDSIELSRKERISRFHKSLNRRLVALP
ncbi:paired amphipathic helix protein Sin3-like 5 isoform X2 [Arabidopsis lyrata subsp. lyrata]|uniref:paired amphipathic helix protein Sin3-like 5 isoform X2 n=1 Tax=Arabidopsis lyrata subsp. lyrata TaxID=81972 RepID=UPI000A29C0C2|nr:paired amphipathic helix protein Sin3-like 5 isoform X2 [Arabidopsis lyrata subsp. lyrata]|eukprot:XP_020890278.1 paired amphipathic helix protein Sin3-like 5 isoform X2 [Arabidopsis lyrata subsp. lyrata]